MNSFISTFNALFSQFTHRNEAIEARFDFHESTEVRQFDDFAFDDVAFSILFSIVEPGITHGVFYGQGNALCILVDALNVYIQFLTNFENIRRMLHAVPSQVGDMSQTIYAADVNECTVVNDTLNRTANDGISLQRGEYFVFLLSANSFEELAAGKNQTLLVYIDFDDFAFNRLTSIYGQIFYIPD